MTTGVLPYRTFKDRVLDDTGFFECSTTDTYTAQGTSSGNHDGAGMSMGNLQYNFGSANRLTELWQYMINNYEQDCIDAFGTHTTEYNTWKTAVMSAVQQDRLNFGINITDPNNDHAVIQPYKDAFMALGNKQSHIDKYKAIADQYYFAPAESLFKQLSCTSRMAYASIFDVYINRGRYYPVNMLMADFDAIDADTTLTADQKETQKIQLINDRGNQPENAMDSSASTFKPRRDCMRNEGGSYYGLTYSPSTQFDMNHEPAIDTKAPKKGVNLGTLSIDNLYLGSSKVDSIYLGANLLGGGITPYTVSTVPTWQFRTNSNSYAGIGSATSVTLNSGQKMWIDIQEPFVACRTYYTTDGTTPSATNGKLYDKNALSFTSSVTLKAICISTAGVASAVKTLTVNVASAPVTTISPSATVQNNIPITVTLSTSESGATIYYMIGTDTTQRTYSAPFTVNQNTAGVASTQIKITYWAVGATATETQKTITYDTSGAIPSAPVVTATAGTNSVALSWGACTNTTSYSVYRSTTAPTLGNSATYGTALSQYQTGLSYTDNTAVGGTLYYYTVEAGNYQTHTDTIKSATPTTAPSKPTYQYIKVLGYGASETGQEVTTRLVEIEVMSGGVNILSGKSPISNDAVSTGGTIDKATDGNKTGASGTYPIWWTSPTPNGNLVYNFGAQKTIDSISYYGYSVSGTQRTNRFSILGSNTNNGTDWVTIWDNSTGQAGLQPILPTGFTKTF